MTRFLEQDTNTNIDISSATAIGSYTADTDRLILCQFFVDQAVGNGDYDFYLTQQIGGSGSSYRHVPKTTATVASGVTAIAGQSIMVAVRSGDVLTAYLDGLAGDTVAHRPALASAGQRQRRDARFLKALGHLFPHLDAAIAFAYKRREYRQFQE